MIARLIGNLTVVDQRGRAQYAILLEPAEYHGVIQLDAAAWHAAWLEGRSLSLEQAVAYALEERGHT